MTLLSPYEILPSLALSQQLIKDKDKMNALTKSPKVTLFNRSYGAEFNTITLSPTEGNFSLPTFNVDISSQTASLPKAMRGILALGIANLISARFASVLKDSNPENAMTEAYALIQAILDGSYTTNTAVAGTGYGIAGITQKLAAAAVAVKYNLTTYGQALAFVNADGFKSVEVLVGVLAASKEGSAARRSALLAKVPQATGLIAKWDAEYALTKRSRPSTKAVVEVEEVSFEF